MVVALEAEFVEVEQSCAYARASVKVLIVRVGALAMCCTCCLRWRRCAVRPDWTID